MMDGRFRSLGVGVVVALVGLLAIHGPVFSQGVGVALTPSAQDVNPGAVFDLDISVPLLTQPFNGFDAVIQYDPAAVTLIPRSPITLQEGALMVGKCGSTFHLFRQGAGTDTITDVLMCNRATLHGLGQLYHLQFQASTAPQVTEIRLLPGVRFYNDGLFIEPVYATNAIVSIRNPSGVEGPGLIRGLRLQIRPNPVVDHALFSIEAGQAGTQRLTILDLQGRVVRRFADVVGSAGNRVVAWDRRDVAGDLVPSGVYFVKCEMGGHSVSKRVSLVR